MSSEWTSYTGCLGDLINVAKTGNGWTSSTYPVSRDEVVAAALPVFASHGIMAMPLEHEGTAAAFHLSGSGVTLQWIEFVDMSEGSCWCHFGTGKQSLLFIKSKEEQEEENRLREERDRAWRLEKAQIEAENKRRRHEAYLENAWIEAENKRRWREAYLEALRQQYGENSPMYFMTRRMFAIEAEDMPRLHVAGSSKPEQDDASLPFIAGLQLEGGGVQG